MWLVIEYNCMVLEEYLNLVGFENDEKSRKMMLQEKCLFPLKQNFPGSFKDEDFSYIQFTSCM